MTNNSRKGWRYYFFKKKYPVWIYAIVVVIWAIIVYIWVQYLAKI